VDESPKFSLLVVDDESANLAVLNTILRADYDIFTAKSGNAALTLTMEKHPDLILLDIMMPDVDGFEVLKRLKDDAETRKIPVIIITGLESEASEVQGFTMGAVDYIRKPFKPDLVRARVRAHIEIVVQARASEQLGLTDPLTGIANRRNFDERIAMEWRRAIRDKCVLSFLMMDLDNYKIYNDTFGHPQGDILLKTVAKLFASKVKRPADLTARIGGEEFSILLPNTSLGSALAIAEDVLKGVESLRIPTADGSSITSTTISIGVASMVPTYDDSMDDFIAQADKNLYKAKAEGRNRICYVGQVKT
jgi:diguanylate cyclase (GGDEF)-like protein